MLFSFWTPDARPCKCPGSFGDGDAATGDEEWSSADGAQADEEADEKADEAHAGWRALQQRSGHQLAVLDRVGMLCSSAACLSTRLNNVLAVPLRPELWHSDAAFTALLLGFFQVRHIAAIPMLLEHSPVRLGHCGESDDALVP